MRLVARLAFLLCSVCAFTQVFAQDAQTALSTSVGYNTRRLSLKLSPQVAADAERLGREAQAATQAGKYADAVRLYAQGTVIMLGGEWTPEAEYVTALKGSVDNALPDKGTLALTVAPQYRTERMTAAKVTAAIALVRKGGSPVSFDAKKVDPNTPLSSTLHIPDDARGDYNVIVTFVPESGPVPETLGATYTKTVPVHIEPALYAEIRKLESSVSNLNGNKNPALATVQFALQLCDRAKRGEVNPQNIDFHKELSAAQTIADALTAGKDPFAGRHGDFHLAYRSNVDNDLQPYRLFVPDSYDGSKATPLVVALHGMGGDENSMFDGYGKSVTAEAGKKGFLVVAPKGRGLASMYRGTAEQDVMDVLAEVRRDYKVDPARIYLMGHSMGGYGTWSVAVSHPDVFAALAPISGGGDTAALAKIKNIPEYVTHGDDDRTVNVSQSRRMVEAGKKLGIDITYVEVPGGSHGGVAQPAIAPIMEFFSHQAQGKSAESSR
jgi:predicted esterase